MSPSRIRIPVLLLAVAFSAPAARAESEVQVAQVEPGEEAAPAEPPPPSRPPADSGIEEIVIQGGESEAAADFGKGDSVTGFDASDLEALGAQSVADLGKFTPNLEIVTSGATTPTFFIRGVGLNDFASNSSSAVAVYQDDVPVNAQGLQLGAIFDMEGINILRGPQGSGAARNASAGAIKLYSRKPTGEFGGYLRSSFGNYNSRDFEGAVEAPIYEDLAAARLAFRFSQRDPYMDNECGGAPSPANRPAGISVCGEDPQLAGQPPLPGGLPDEVNDLNNWAARGTFLFQPTLDSTVLLGLHGGRRNEDSRLPITYGTGGIVLYGTPSGGTETIQTNYLGGSDGSGGFGGFQRPDVRSQTEEIRLGLIAQGVDSTTARGKARLQVADRLARKLDRDPWKGYYDSVGPTRNDVWGGYLRGEVVLPNGMELTSLSGYDTYDRFIDADLDGSPNVNFEIVTDDDAWQFTQDLRLAGALSEDIPVRWEMGGFYLQEKLNVNVDNRLPIVVASTGVSAREYTQDIYSLGSYMNVEWDFADDFTLDGGFRWNQEWKAIDYTLVTGTGGSLDRDPDRMWNHPTGFTRLTYRFREDTHAYLKFTHGFKSGHFNATGSVLKGGVTPVSPEKIDAWETGLRGAWFNGRLALDASLFYYQYEDYQLFTVENEFRSPPAFVIINASDAEVYGSEVDLTTRPWLGSFFNVRFSWLESHFLDFVQTQFVQRLVESPTGNLEARVFQTEIDHSGNRLLNSPQFKVSFTAEQTLPLGRWGSVTARYDGAWTDDTNFDQTEGRGLPNDDDEIFLPRNTIGQNAYMIHNVRLAYRTPDGRIEIAGFGRNLTNKAYKTFAFNVSNFFNSTVYFVGEPRTYGLTLTANF